MSTHRKAEEVAANSLAVHWTEGLPVDPVVITRRVGVEVFSADLGMEACAVLYGDNGKGIHIYIERSLPPSRYRAVSARMLDHVLYQQDAGKERIGAVERRLRPNESIEERWADEFAGALLLPQSELTGKEREGSIAAAARFEVPLDFYTQKVKSLSGVAA